MKKKTIDEDTSPFFTNAPISLDESAVTGSSGLSGMLAVGVAALISRCARALCVAMPFFLPVAAQVYPEKTLARMNFPPNLTAEQLWNLGGRLDDSRQPAKAAAAFLKCSEMGHVRCTSALGQMYDQGRGVPLDRIRAVWYLTRAANAGNRGAEYEIGVYWEEGEVLPLDMKKAMEWYMKSAQLGFLNAERRIGLAYEIGEGLPRSRPLAIAWLSKSAAQGDALSIEVFRMLRSPNTPARFRDFDSFAAYYQSLYRAQFTGRPARVGGFNGNAYAHNNAVSAYYAAGNPAGAATCAATPSCSH